MLRRKAYNHLLKWKNEMNGKTAMLVKGARRVGKSFVCVQFGKNEYKSVINIDFSNVSEEIKEYFNYDSSNLDIFFSKLSIFFNTRLHNRETLFIFDEVQMFPRARELIKHLVADGRYDYIETGSLLSIQQNVMNILIPSEEDVIEMFPLDFEEFLWAIGDDQTFPFLQSSYEEMRPLGQALHKKVMNDFRQYMLVGGMPQAVLAFIKGMDYAAADREKKRILTLYRNDIVKFAKGYESRVTAIFDALPGQLAKKEKKFKLSSIHKDARFRVYEDAFMWLTDGMICNPCFNATDPNVGLALSFDHTVHKLYMADTGLLVTHAFADNNFSDNELYRAILLDKLSVNEGMLTENIVAQILRSSGHRLYFYSRSDTNNRSNMMEIDFLIKKNGKICPVEVKSSTYKQHISLDKFNKKFRVALGNSYILYTKDIMIKDNIIHLPIYMTMFL
ncbi:MAG: ATP-binding protein [Oscillospiraceae bacterium]|nr:ATP-binding protein [Oscillospiraceae bacterium]